MPEFNPGPEWRELIAGEFYTGPRRDQLTWYGTEIGDVRYFVRNDSPLEPRAATAKAVLDEIRNTVAAHMDHIDQAILDEVGREFGVTDV